MVLLFSCTNTWVHNASSRGNPLSSSSSHQNPLTYLFINVLACNRCFCIFLLIQTRQLFHWRKRYYELWTRVLDESNILQVKIYWWMHFLWKQLFSSQDVNWWTGVVWITCGLLWCFYQLFGRLILTAPIHCRASIDEQVDIMLNFSKSKERTNSSLGWPGGECIFIKFSFSKNGSQGCKCDLNETD